MKALSMYFLEIDGVNIKIGKTKGWKEYAKKFKKVHPRLYKAIMDMTAYEVRTIKNEYLRNWIKNLRSEE